MMNYKKLLKKTQKKTEKIDQQMIDDNIKNIINARGSY